MIAWNLLNGWKGWNIRKKWKVENGGALWSMSGDFGSFPVPFCKRVVQERSPFAFPELVLCRHFINVYCNQNPNPTVVRVVSPVQSVHNLIIQLHWTGMSVFHFRLEGGAMPSSIHYFTRAASSRNKQRKNILLMPSFSNIAFIHS